MPSKSNKQTRACLPRKKTNKITEIPFCLRLKPPGYVTYFLIRLEATSKALLFNASLILLSLYSVAFLQLKDLQMIKHLLKKSKHSQSLNTVVSTGKPTVLLKFEAE